MNKSVRILAAILTALMLLTFAAGCSEKDSGDTTDYAINYNVQGHLFKENESKERSLVEAVVFTARNAELPGELKDGELKTNEESFQCIQLRGFPSMQNEENLSAYTRRANNGILEVQVAKSGSIRDRETGEVKMITEVSYQMFIDEQTNELLLCQITAEMDGQTQQYYFSPSPNSDSINDVLIRAYQK